MFETYIVDFQKRELPYTKLATSEFLMGNALGAMTFQLLAHHFRERLYQLVNFAA
ncbi:hypothetical protein I41_09030 [Lacipirellula limnantheis]|uniref:Uncharacterized protein n=1 Tax=Lacipirellula limnantheis TaxID=2528024 RepID=A0A517TTQ8_9BACT|nr:hypothetical protein I41_09030 [Lacipirellula limnantheis]